MLDIPPPDPGIEIVIATRGMTREGVAQTDGIQLIPRAFVLIGPVQAGGQWKNVNSPVAKGIAAAFANATLKLDAFQLTSGVAYKFQTGVRGPTDSDAFEFAGAIKRQVGRVGLTASLAYSPNDVGTTKRSLYFEAGATLAIAGSARFSANAGHRQRIGGPDHTSFNAGFTASLRKWLTVDARYYDTAQGELGEPYHGRLVLSARLGL